MMLQSAFGRAYENLLLSGNSFSTSPWPCMSCNLVRHKVAPSLCLSHLGLCSRSPKGHGHPVSLYFFLGTSFSFPRSPWGVLQSVLVSLSLSHELQASFFGPAITSAAPPASCHHLSEEETNFPVNLGAHISWVMLSDQGNLGQEGGCCAVSSCSLKRIKISLLLSVLLFFRQAYPIWKTTLILDKS